MKKQAREPRRTAPQPSRSRAFYYSLLLHAAIVLVFVVGLDFARTPAPLPAGESKVLNAKAVDSRAVEQEMQKLKTAEQAKQREAERKVEEAERRRKQEEQRLEQLKAEKEKLKREQETETQRLAEQKQQLEREKVAEQQRQEETRKAEEQKKKAAEQKKLEEKKQAEVEAKKKAEAEAEAKKKAEADKKKQAEEAKKKAEEAKRAAEEKRKAEEAKALADAMAEEEAELAAAAQARADQTMLSKYVGAITRQVEANFVQSSMEAGLKCTLLVRMIPGGQVIDAKVIKSSGNPAFDRRAELAVRKASPLPVPDEPRLFQQMKEIQFEFDPGRT